MIELRDLRFAYGNGEFSVNVDELSVSRGERIALVGPSGSGKTTLIHLLAGIFAPERGAVRLDDLDLAALSVEDRQDLRVLRMGLVFQEFELLDYLDVLDNILLSYRINSALTLDGTTRQRAVDLARQVGIGDKLRRHPQHLSQGERQRVAVCRALVTQPILVLGDEPTANLDPRNRDQVMDILFDYAESNDAALVVVTHDHELMPRFDRVVEVEHFASAAGAGPVPGQFGRSARGETGSP
jgi:ABC-type lipoprotein export system ATPase subunit